MKGLILTCLLMLSVSLIYAECDFMAMLAKNNYQISDFNEAEDYFDFQEARSKASAQEDGYGVIYYKNNQDTIHYNHNDPLAENNQAFYLIGPKNSSWYGCHGPDAFGKYYNDSNHPDGPDYNWIDISELGTQVEFTHNDSASERLSIGFDFEFYGLVYDSLLINPNGWISFGDDNDQYNNTDVYNNDPDEGIQGPAIFGFWDDLYPAIGVNGGGDVYYYSNGNDTLIVWFDDVIHYPGSQNGTYDFQMIILENGNIKFQYRELSGDTDSATIGIKAENSYANSGFFQIVCNGEYVEDSLAVLFSTDVYDDPEPLDIAEERIMIPENNATVVLGHDRNRAGVSAGAAGQHPYRFDYTDPETQDTITYTFQHNGWHEYKEPMYWYCKSYNSDWFNKYPLNWGFLGNNIYNLDTVNDTEILFHYFMAHIIEFKGDVIAGMIAAFNETAVYDSSGIVYNFQEIFRDNWNPNRINSVLSDGESLYLFRNSNDASPAYNLSYKEYGDENEFVGVKTQEDIPGGTQVQQYSLVEIPREGEIVTYENVFEIDAKIYTFPSQFTLPDVGWKWLSFDILYSEPDDNIAENFLAPISWIDELDKAKFKPHSPNSYVQTISFYPIQQNLDHPFTSPYGYKFHTLTDCEFIVIGERCPADTTFPLFGNNQANWIGYFLEETQHVYDAFGGFTGYLDNFTGIRTQHWAIKKENGGWPRVPYTISPGDMVIVYCTEDVPLFTWNFVESREKYIVPGSQDFTFEEEADYIPVFISLDPEALPSEIGAYVDGECKGATVVQDTSSQLCAYILENQGQNLEFEFSYGGREQNKRIKEYGIYDPETSKTVKGSIQINNSRDCYYVSFKDGQNNTPVPAKIEITNFPNPFNPETTLFFSLPNEQKIELTVYNLKGQKVRKLVKGQFSAGQNSIVWNGKDDSGKQVSSGVYLYKLETADKIISKKMLLLK